jgi:hypothetical protein
MIAVGVVLLRLSRRHTCAMHSSTEVEEGTAVDTREPTAGLKRDDIH